MSPTYGQVIQQTKFPGQKSFSAKVILGTHRHTYQTDYSTWTTTRTIIITTIEFCSRGLPFSRFTSSLTGHWSSEGEPLVMLERFLQ